jgi:PAS domain S-box-containing protein
MNRPFQRPSVGALLLGMLALLVVLPISVPARDRGPTLSLQIFRIDCISARVAVREDISNGLSPTLLPNFVSWNPYDWYIVGTLALFLVLAALITTFQFVRQKGRALQALTEATTTQVDLAIRENEARFRSLADAVPVMIWMSGPDKLYTYFSKKWLEFTGRPLEREMGNGWLEGIHRLDLPTFVKSFSEEFTARREFRIEYRLRRFDGRFRWVLDAGMPRYGPDKQFLGYVGCCSDINERREAEEALLEVSGRLIAAQEDERARIARELHDDLSQRMAMLEIGLDQLKQKLSTLSPSLKKQLEDINQIATEVSSYIHHLSHKLHPSKLNNLGLVATLHGLCRELSEQYNLKVHFTYHNIPRAIPNDVSLCLYRISQEALWNIVKHSSAREGKLELSGYPEEIDLCVSDTGTGFDPETAKEKTGLGLISMRERLRAVGGHLSVESEPSHGTQICARVPLSKDAAGGPRNDSGARAVSA